jgi:acyl-CoA synthetase (AMP-forming)/AMP-acid ligase II
MTMPADIMTLHTLVDVTEAQAVAIPDKIAFRFEGRELDYRTFGRHTNQVANALAAAGVRHGERIAHLGKNTDRYFELLFGAARLGAVMVPINWRLAGPEIVYILNDCRAKVLFVGPEFAGLVASIAADLTDKPLIVAVEGGGPGWLDYPGWRDAAPSVPSGTCISPDDVAIQLYTSGTTGRPKGAMLTHASLFGLRLAAGDSQAAWDRWQDDDIALIAMPVFHIGGSAFGIQVLRNGATGVIAREFDVYRILDFIEQDRISKIFLVPSALQIIVRSPRVRDVDYRRIRYILYGAAPMPLALLRECMEIFGCGFVQMYGMTETSGTIVALPPEDHDPNGGPRMRSAGKALAGVEIMIVDERGNPLPAGQVGEIVTRSAANMKGYWNLAEATASTLDGSGWLRTGDAGYMDEDGYLFIHDRVKDMIVSGGENVYPAEVENAIFGHPDVADVAVIGVPDEKWGEAVKALVVLKSEKSLDGESILNWARSRIAAFKVPKSVETIDALPRNASGKVLRRELREPYWAGQQRRVN